MFGKILANTLFISLDHFFGGLLGISKDIMHMIHIRTWKTTWWNATQLCHSGCHESYIIPMANTFCSDNGATFYGPGYFQREREREPTIQIGRLQWDWKGAMMTGLNPCDVSIMMSNTDTSPIIFVMLCMFAKSCTSLFRW